MSNKKVYKINEFPIDEVKESLFNKNDFGARPFLKWAGGKGQLFLKFQELYPLQLKENKIKNFYEPFLGNSLISISISNV